MEKIEVRHLVVKDFQSAESVKTLRSNLMFCGNSVRAVALTSFSASEGKSSISFQLAASLAQAGRRVLLLDTDLRKSMLQQRLKVKGKIDGVSHYLSGMCEMERLVHETDVPGMYIMFAGVWVPNASELLGGDRFKEMIPVLKEQFDYVIVDAPPLGQVIDCAVMAPELDGVVVVIDTTRNSYKLQKRIKSQLEMSGGKILGVILNRVDFKDKGGYYGKAYGYGSKYGYGYGYGYGEKELEEMQKDKQDK